MKGEGSEFKKSFVEAAWSGRGSSPVGFWWDSAARLFVTDGKLQDKTWRLWQSYGCFCFYEWKYNAGSVLLPPNER